MIGFDYGYLWEWEEFDAPRLLEVMADFDAAWWMAGGWALDLWMERESRSHQDVDIAILRGDSRSFTNLFVGGSCTTLPPIISYCPYAPSDGFTPRSTAYGRGGPTMPHGCASSS